MSCSQTVSLLKMLASEGRTIVTTIHQPSALIFEMFDNLYALSDGHCIYNGPTRELVPYLGEKGLQCPIYHNPADFLMEVAQGDHISKLDDIIISSEKPKEGLKKTNLSLASFIIEEVKGQLKDKRFLLCSSEQPTSPTHLPQQSFFFEFYHLYMRNLIMLQRSFKYRLWTVMAHFICGILAGLTFYNSGNNAALVRSNLACVFGMLVFIIYVSAMSVCLILPNDLRSFQKEHFNQWYSLTPYYLAILTIEIPVQTINILFTCPILYYLEGQPFENFRFFTFLATAVIFSLSSQALGFFIGSSIPLKLSVFVGPVLFGVMAVFGFTLRYTDTMAVFRMMALLSTFRAAFSNIVYFLFSFDRGALECKEDQYCHFHLPEKLLKEMDLESVDVYANFIYLVTLGFIFHILTYSVLYRKLNNR